MGARGGHPWNGYQIRLMALLFAWDSKLDGSKNNDYTAISAETIDGYSFTPRWQDDQRPTMWNPALTGGRIPHSDVAAAVDELMRRFKVKRFYCDPQDWDTDIDNWGLLYGVETVITWPTNRISAMHAELVRFEEDLIEQRIQHDGCPITTAQIANARKKAQPGQRYTIEKPNEHQKIDMVMARVLAHTAARDSIAAGWAIPKPKPKLRVWNY
ncbi:terminase TerL endonuclease subunit [Clavibacter capsici]|uniref:terminase TerL endonuclease subunit n=1 Tax=Clavibacter capsici TaxID=1874630 RepID=UPI00287B7F8A|nr:terminase TerL endonuclease subunit [Clavibacter capsici]